VKKGIPYKMTEFVLKHVLPDEYDFQRMKNHGRIDFIKNMDYAAFVAHNVEISNSLSKKDREFCIKMIDYIMGAKLKTLDMESPHTQEVNNVFFDLYGELVLVNPR
jgi:hypothetical protein